MEQANVTDIPEAQVGMLLAKIAAEPDSRDILYKTLVYCQEKRTTSDIETQIRSWTVNRSILHTPQSLMTILTEGGGLQPVESDEGQTILHTTSVGNAVVITACPSNRLEALFDSEPEYVQIYLRILQECVTPHTLSEMEDIMEGNETMKKENILVSYFISELEEAGGIEWDIKWKTTQTGIDTLNMLKPLRS